MPEKTDGKITREEYDALRARLDAEKGKIYKPGKGREATAAEIIQLVK